MHILGIETSCDETGIAVYSEKKGLLSNKLYSQTKLHKKYGGVVPELASRDHIKKIIPLIKEALIESKILKKNINAIAYTAGPGLINSLLVGATIAHSLSFAWKIPVIPIHHLEGHLFSIMLEKKFPKYPFISLIASGGHTKLIKVMNFNKYEILGRSIDDSAGEAFDKVAKLLGLEYPGGPNLSLVARNGEFKKFIFPRPMLNHPGFNFSFSGLKSSVARIIHKNTLNKQTIANIAHAFEHAIIDILTIKTKKAIQKMGIKNLTLCGGVSANKSLRKKMKKEMKKIGKKVFYPKIKFCTDNGAMIALVGLIRFKKKLIKKKFLTVNPNWSLKEL